MKSPYFIKLKFLIYVMKSERYLKIIYIVVIGIYYI